MFHLLLIRYPRKHRSLTDYEPKHYPVRVNFMKQMNLAKLNPEKCLTWDRSVQNYLSNIDVHNDGSTKHSVTSKIARKESYREHVWTRIKGSLPDIVKRRVAHISRGNVKQLLHEIRVICNGRRQKYVKENIQCRDFLKQSCLRGEECRFLHSTKSPPTRFSNFQKGRIPVGKIPKNAKFDQGNHPFFKSSTYERYYYNLDSGYVEIVCYDMSEKSKKTDSLYVIVDNKNFTKFLKEVQYK